MQYYLRCVSTNGKISISNNMIKGNNCFLFFKKPKTQAFALSSAWTLYHMMLPIYCYIYHKTPLVNISVDILIIFSYKLILLSGDLLAWLTTVLRNAQISRLGPFFGHAHKRFTCETVAKRHERERNEEDRGLQNKWPICSIFSIRDRQEAPQVQKMNTKEGRVLGPLVLLISLALQ